MKLTRLLLFALVLVLTACQGQPTVEPTPLAVASATPEGVTPPTTTVGPTLAAPTEGLATPVSQANVPSCTVNSPAPTPGPTERSIFPAVTEADWTVGPETAAVTIIEYSDFQCPYCAQLAPVLAQLHESYPDQVRIVFRHLPLIGTPDRPFHDKAAISAQASEAAGKQEMFWEMYDLLFAKQSEWASLTPEQFQEWVVGQAVELGLDEEQFTADLTSPELEAIPQEAWDHAQKTGMVYTPLVLVNDQLWPNNLPISYENLAAITELEMLQARQFTDCPPMVIDPSKEYVATLHTAKGDIVLELFAEQAPLAVNNFVFLAQEGWYDGVTFHRVLPGFVAQAGDPTGTGYGGPGYAFKNEITPDLNFQEPGMLAMANSGPDTNGSQFFITTAPTPNLEGGYTIFGQVIEGMDVVESLTPRDPSRSMNLPPGDQIESVTIEER